MRHIFIVDDMMHKKRLLALAEAIKPLGVDWMCQLKPTIDLDEETLKILFESGLKVIIWGVESANDRVLALMRKGTNIKDVTTVIRSSHKAGIKNVVYIMFGFPTETKEEAKETIKWLEDNKEYIGLVSTSVFGLQKNTDIYEHPERYAITKVIETPRTVLDGRLDYKVCKGMSNQEARYLRKSHAATIKHINKFPKTMNFFREHMLCLSK